MMSKDNKDCERVGDTNASLHCKKTIIRDIVVHVVKWLNSFPVKSRISKILSLKKIITGKTVSFSKDCQLEVVSYIQAPE